MEERGVLITGGSRGIGEALVRHFARRGDRVWFTYRLGAGRAAGLEQELAGEGHTVSALEFSQGDWPSHQQLAQELSGSRIDVLVNNAAVGSSTVDRYAAGGDHARDAAFLQINTLGPLWLTRQFAPAMISRGYGKVVNISSVGGGISQFPQFDVADGMSKAATAYMTRHLAAQWGKLPIDVFAVCPGAVDTAMFQASTLEGLAAEEHRRLESGLPGGRLIRPQEIADLVGWLCEDSGTVMRGAVVDASMGLGCDTAALERTGSYDDWSKEAS